MITFHRHRYNRGIPELVPFLLSLVTAARVRRRRHRPTTILPPANLGNRPLVKRESRNGLLILVRMAPSPESFLFECRGLSQFEQNPGSSFDRLTSSVHHSDVRRNILATAAHA